MEVFELMNIKTKKDLKVFLKGNSIKYKKQHFVYSFDYKLYDIDFTISTLPLHGSINSFRIVMNNNKYNHYEKINEMLELKKYFTSILGQPKKDSSNHLGDNYLYVEYETDTLFLSINCHDLKEYGSVSYASIFIGPKDFKEKTQKSMEWSRKLGLWILSLAGGIVFGLAMFGMMGGLSNYDFNSFLICMGSGLVWGIAFGLLFGLFVNINKQKQGNQNISKIVNAFHLKDSEKTIKGNLISFISTTPHSSIQRTDVALLFITDIEIVIYSLIKRQKIILKMQLKEAYFSLLKNNLVFNRTNGLYMFSTANVDDYRLLESILFKKCINNDEFDSLFKKLKSATLEYNPYQIYNDNEPNFLDSDIAIVAKGLLVRPNITHNQLYELVIYAFEYDRYYADSLTDLYLKIFSDFIY